MQHGRQRSKKEIPMSLNAAVVGASGFAGAELMRILVGHPEFVLSKAVSDSQAGELVSDAYPSFIGHTDVRFVARDDVDWGDVDVAFLAVPHTASMSMSPGLLDQGVTVIDLSADFRLRDADSFEEYYATPHTAKDVLARSFFGQPELEPDDIAKARQAHLSGDPVLVACAGCYPTASSLAAAPAIRAGLVAEGSPVIVDAISGVTGAGRTPSARTHFCSANENLSVYSLLSHRHTPEMEQLMGGDHPVLFTPHLAPLDRGILSTVTMQASKGAGPISSESLEAVYRELFSESAFVHVLGGSQTPQTSSVCGTNEAHLCVRYSERTGTILAICAIDNLCKGAAGQAVQCANIVFGLDERTGLGSMALPV